MSARRAVTASIAVAALGLGALAPAGAAGKAATITVKLTNTGCPKRLETSAGPTTFKVRNVGADRVHEFEVLSTDRILGQLEHLDPGSAGEFSLTLEAGVYTTFCPGGERSRGKLVVSGTAATKLSPAGKAAVDQYRTYVEEQSADLVAATKTFTDAVQAGDVQGAVASYAAARIPYEHIEPVAEAFGDLDPRIDARAGDVPKQRWGGFHKIEQALYANHTLDGMAAVAEQLQADVAQLQNLVADVQLEPATIANGAVELLNEVSASKITGEEERYSHTDLVDFLANVEGAQAAFEAVKPVLKARDPQLAAQIERQFAAVYATLQPYGSGARFVSYTDLTTDDTSMLSQAVDDLAEPLSKVGKRIVAATQG